MKKGCNGEKEKIAKKRDKERKKSLKKKSQTQRERAILSQQDCPEEEILSVKGDAVWNIVTLELSKSTFPISVYSNHSNLVAHQA